MSDSISVECPQCGAKLKLKNRNSVGKRVPCPKCKKPFLVKVPDADDDPEFMNVSEPDDEFAVPPDDDVAAQMSGRPPVRSGRPKPKPGPSKKQRRDSGNRLKSLLVAGAVLAVLGLIGGVGYFVAPLISDLLSRNKIDLAWLPPDAELIVQARVADTWNSPFVKSLANGPAGPPGLPDVKGLIGLGPEEIRSVTIGATGVFNQPAGGGPGPTAGMNPAAGALPMNGALPRAIVVVRTTQPFEPKPMQQKLGATRTEPYQKQELIYPGGALTGQVCFLPDTSTIVFGSEGDLKAAIDRGAKAARRVDLDFIDPTRQVLMVAAPKDPSAFDSRGTASPIPIEALSKIEAALKGKVKAFCLGMSFTDNMDWSVVANCTSTQAAADVSTTLDNSLKDVKTQFDQIRSNAPPQFSDLVVTGGDILGSIKLQTQGELMQANGRIPGSIKTAVEKLPQLMLAGALGGLPGLGGEGGAFDANAFSGPEKSTIDPTAPGQVNSNPLLTAEQAARLARSKNNLKQLGLAMHNYHDVNQQLPGSAIRDNSSKPLLSWRVALLPYLDQGDLYKAFHLDEPWDSTHNMTLIPQMPALFASPEGKAAPGATSYLAVAGPGAIFESGAPRKIADVSDGTSNTILIVEADDSLAVTWTRPDDYVYVPEKPMQGLVGRHAGGFLALTCDGAAHFVAETLDPLILVSLYTFAGGEQIPPGILR